MPKENFKNQRKPTQEVLDAIENSNKPLRPQPEMPSGGMGGKKEGGLVRFKKQYQMHNGKF